MGVVWTFFSLTYHFSFLSPSLWGTARYRLKYCLKGPLSLKQPTNHRLVAVYYVFTLAVHVSVCQFVHSTSIRTLFPLDNWSTYLWISFKLCICIHTNTVSLGIVNGQISIIHHRVVALVSIYKKWFWPLVPLLFGVS